MIKKLRFILPLAAVLLFLCAKPGYCWDKYGHMIIAQIAYDHLTPTARANADQLIEQFNSDPLVTALPSQFTPYNFVTAAAMMDDQKDVTKAYNTWHYVDLPDDPNLTVAQVESFTDDNPSNAYKAITTYCLPTMRDKTASAADRARALGFFLHLAGDIHQPLHAIGRDRGGNSYAITEIPSADPDWPIKTLHPFWDGAYRYGGAGGSSQPTITSSDLPRITAPGQDPVKRDADYIMKNYAPDDQAQVDDLNPAEWALESNRIAVNFAFPADGSHTLSPDYIAKAHDIACRRLALAGLRIAAVLNEILGS